MFMKKLIGVGICVLFLCFIMTLVLFHPNVDGAMDDNVSLTEEPHVEADELPSVVREEDAYKVEDLFPYDKESESAVVNMYLTVRNGNAADNTNHSWAVLNRNSVFFYEDLNIERYRVEAILQVGDENGPLDGEFGYGAMIPNAFVQIRGNTTSRAPQKSFKISLKEGMGEWCGQTTIALNKHPYECLRFRNKLCFDLIKDIPNMISLHTQFVHLFVKDESNSGTGAGFEDYGLFTQVEQPNKTYLSNHGLDRNGHLYKANYFEFTRYEDVIKLETDPGFNVEAFAQIVESKGNHDHAKLIEMLESVNNYNIPIEQTLEKYFDMDNYFTWLAFHILVFNADTINRNFYLYSPLNSKKFYFISWDADGALQSQESILLDSRDIPLVITSDEYFGYQQGISNYWEIVLHQRVLETEQYRGKLDEKINELKQFLTQERMNQMVEMYRGTIEHIVYAEPDVSHTSLSREHYDYIADTLADEIDLAYSRYQKSLMKPMPFYSGLSLTESGEQIEFLWDPAFSFHNLSVTYEFELAKDVYFKNIIFTEQNIVFPNIKMKTLETGRYYYRITAVNEDGFSQGMASYFTDLDSNVYFGIIGFDVLPDGRIEIVESERESKERTSGSRVAGSRVAGSRVAGSRVPGSRASGSRVAGSRVSGSIVAGSRN